MSVRTVGRLRISVWPFLIAFLPELWVAWTWVQTVAVSPPPTLAARFIVMQAVTLSVELAVVWAIRHYLPPPGRIATWILEYTCASILGSIVLIFLAPTMGLPRIISFSAWGILAVNRLANAISLAFIIDVVIRQWRMAAASADRLAVTLRRVARVNAVLRTAKDTLFTYQAEFIRERVLAPLQRLAHQSPTMGDDELADSIDHLVRTTMRPLAHEMHPVTLNVGLLAALQSLDGRFTVSADAGVLALDASGELLDPEVRLQVYRWIRLASRAGGSTDVVLSIDGRSLRVLLRDGQAIAALDPMMAVAGLHHPVETDSVASEIVAPLRGQFVDQVLAGDAWVASTDEPDVDAAIALPRAGWADILTAAPRGKVFWTAVLALGSIAGFFSIAAAGVGEVSWVSAGSWLVFPLVAAFAVDLVPVRPGSRAGAVWVVAGWLAIGVVAGLSDIIGSAVVGQFVGEPVGSEWNISVDWARALVRFSVAGILITVGRGYAARARGNTAYLQERLDVALCERALLLDLSDQQERFIAERLHRSVQGRMSAISLLLRLGRRDQALDELDLLRTATVPAIASQMTQAWKPEGAHFLDPADLPMGLEVLEAIDAAAIERIDPRQVEEIRRFAGECAVNARVHGDAGRFEISLQRDDERLVLVCSNNGAPLADAIVPGLGSALFNEVVGKFGGSWRYLPTTDGVIVTAVLPLATGALPQGTPAGPDASHARLVTAGEE